MIIRLQIITILTLLFFTVSCGSTNQFTPAQTGNPLTVDGNLSDWNTSETLFEDREQANYYSSFDDNFLYLFVDIRSALKDMSVRRSGLTVYLSDEEETRKKIGVSFPPGTFNLLREYPGAFNNFTSESDWMSKPENQELLENLEDELFSKVMIVQRSGGEGDASYGFVDISQLEVDGMEIAINQDSRTIGLEMKIPRDGSSIYGFSGREVWLGFAIEPPEFNIQDNSNYSPTSSGTRDRYGNQTRRQPRPRQNIGRSLGQMERWYLLSFDQ